jgi:5-carboxymethyl-2-hydroxymuconate isomerase
MMASGLFNDADIKTSAIPIEQWQIGTGPAASITP